MSFHTVGAPVPARFGQAAGGFIRPAKKLIFRHPGLNPLLIYRL
jgi:hypothetical protein